MMRLVRLCLLVCLVLVAQAAFAKPRRGKSRPPVAPVTAPGAPLPSPTPEPPPEPQAAPVPAPAPQAAPEAPPPQPAPPPPEKKGADLEPLNAEYLAIRDELFRSRAKVALLGSALYKTRLVLSFQYKAGRAWPLKKVSLRIDDQPVYAADAPQAEEPLKIYEGFAAPGRHSVTLRVESGAVGDTRSAYHTENTFVFDLADNRQSKVELTVDENGDGPAPFAKRNEGTFDVRVKAKVRNLPLEAK